VPSLKGRSIWMAVAALWLVAVSTIFTVVSLVMIGTSAARLLVFAVIVAVIVYLAIGVGVIRALRALTRSYPAADAGTPPPAAPVCVCSDW